MKIDKKWMGILGGTITVVIIFVYLIQIEIEKYISQPITIPQVQSAKTDATDLFLVTKVVDGDTFEIRNGIKVRMIGIDTPETVDPKRPVECYGKEASNFTKTQLEGKMVKLEKDVSETDRYGRLLRYVWLGEVMVNEELVKQGYAQISTYPPDVKYQDRFLTAQTEARNNNLGLWGEQCLQF